MMVHVSKVMVGKGMQLPEGKALKDLASKVPHGQHDWFVEQFEKQVLSRGGGGGWGELHTCLEEGMPKGGLLSSEADQSQCHEVPGLCEYVQGLPG
jgi:hypothetical protein